MPVGQCRIKNSTCRGELIRAESDMRTRLNLCHSDGCIHYLAQEGARECAHGSLGRAVHAAIRVRFPARNRPNVDNMARVASFEVCRDLSVTLQMGSKGVCFGEMGVP
jgi:hypothetical protein